MQGTLVALRNDTVQLERADSSTASYSIGAVERLHVSQGLRRHTLAGAGFGFLVGGAVTWLVWRDFCDANLDDDAAEPAVCLGIAALGGAAGAGLGAIIGAAYRTDRWRTVPLEGLRVSRRPQGGLAVGLSLRI